MRPLGTEPVKQSMSTCRMSCWPVWPSPAMNVNTSASSGTARIVSISGSMNRGATSDGLTITAEPANRAGTGSRQDSISGPFHGEITPTSGYGTSWVRNVTLGMIELVPDLAAASSTAGGVGGPGPDAGRHDPRATSARSGSRRCR